MRKHGINALDGHMATFCNRLPLDAPLMFRGSFESAMEQVFELYRTAQKPLYAQASRMQCIITVSDTRDGR